MKRIIIKRYVKEFAADEMKCCSEKRKALIKRILRHYENGFITALEAVKSICDTYYDDCN